jgi:peptidoglycan/xylan/chitin deacetylase (PgdA/CDA1 family)
VSVSARAWLARAAHRLAATITGADTREPVVALTFDDGPDPRWTPRVLEVLEAHGARATFFMLGTAAGRHPELVARAAAAGHAIANHSWDHAAFSRLHAPARRRQLRACQRAISPYGLRLFRPPYGEQTLATRLDALWLRYAVIGWTVDSGDWWDPDPVRIADTLDRRVAPGDIVLFHDALALPEGLGTADGRRPAALSRAPHHDRQAMLAALERFLAGAAGRFRFVTVPDLLARGRARREAWSRRAAA